MPKTDQTYIQYDYEVLSDPYYNECRIVFTDERTLQLCLSGLRFAEWVNTRWYFGNQQTKLNAAQKEQATDWAERAIGDLLMACDPTEINNNLDRLATALESINEKQIERYTYQEFIDDLEDAFGIGYVLYGIVDGFFGLFPRLKLKADFTEIARDTFRWWRYEKWILAAQKTQAASQITIAGAMAFSKVTGLIDTVVAGLGILQAAGAGWKDLILGDKNLYDDFFKPLLGYWLTTGQGGLEDEPDTDPTTRVSVALNQNLIIQNTINAICCDSADRVKEHLGVGPVVSTDSTDIDTSGTTPPTNDEINWSTQTSPNDERCQAAHYILDWLGLFYGSEQWDLVGSDTTGLTLTSIIETILNSIPPIGVTLSGLSAIIGQILTYLMTGETSLFATVNSIISSQYDNLLCILWNAEDKDIATADFMSIMTSNGLDPLNAWAVELFLSQNNIFGLLFFDNDIVDYSGYSDNCDPCIDCPGDFSLGYGNLVGGSLSNGTTEIVIEAESITDGYGASVYFPDNDCCYEASWNVISGSLLPFKGAGSADWWYYDCEENNHNGEWASGSPPSPVCLRGITTSPTMMFRSSAQFTVRLSGIETPGGCS